MYRLTVQRTLLVVAIILASRSAVWADYSELVVFGDSHSDVGNWTSRFSNGPIWVDELARRIAVPALQPSKLGGSDYAMGGARTGAGVDVLYSQTVPQMGTQIDRFLAENSPRGDQLFSILIGHNDFGWGGQRDPTIVVDRIVENINALAAAGAQHFVVGNVPPLARLPAYRGTNDEDVFSTLVPQFNGLLADSLASIRETRQVSLTEVDFYGMVEEMIASPQAFGLVDVTTPQASNDHLYNDDNHYTSGVYRELGRRAAEAVSPPLESIPLSGAGGVYHQDFDNVLGVNGSSGAAFPTAWTTDGSYFLNATTASFPVAASFLSGSTFNAGAANDSDRALAVGVTGSTDDQFLQLIANVTDSGASSFKLQFDVEAWDARDGTFVPQLNRYVGGADDPGEAAFHVTVDIDAGNGVSQLVDLGTVTTGAVLQAVLGGIVDGNAAANRISFDSGIVAAEIPVGSRVRVRWSPDTEGETAGWVFGLDNVALSLLGSVDSAGDFNGDGVLTAADIDLLTAEIAAQGLDPVFDLSGNGVVDKEDLTTWLLDAAQHNGLSESYLPGDANLDGTVDAGDLNNLALNWRQEVAFWSKGDFTANGTVDAADLNALAINWRQSIPMASSSIVPIPEPSALLLTVVGLVLAWRRPRRS